MTLLRPLVASLAVFALAACDRTAAVVDNSPRWRLDTLLTFSGPTASAAFSSVQGIAMHPDGRLAVVDQKGKAVTVFGPSGNFTAAAANAGAGPGDFRDPYYAAWIGQGIAIYDPEMSRVLFAAHGSAKASSVTVIKVTGSITARFYPVSANKAYLRTVQIDGTTIRPVFLGFADRHIVDTVNIPDIATLRVGTVCKDASGETTYFEWPEAAMQMSVPARDDGAVIYARTDEYRIVLRSAKGDSIGGFTSAFTPVSITNAEWNDGLLAYNQYLVRHGIASCDAKPERPAHRAPIRAITVSPEGDVWITSLGAKGLAFDVFSLDGTKKATIAAPEHDTRIPIAVAGDRVALAVATKDGKHVVRVFRVVR